MDNEPKHIEGLLSSFAKLSANGICTVCGRSGAENLWRGAIVCDDCFKRKVAEDDAVIAMHAARTASICKEDGWDAICPDEYKKPVRYELTDEKSFRTVQGWKYGWPGLIINGPSGMGKTRSIWSLLRRLNQEEGRSFKFFDGYDFSCASADASRNGKELAWMREMVACDVFIFDDLGKNKVTANVEASLFAIIDKRYSAHKPMIITTQHNRSTLQGLFLDSMTADAIMRRLLEGSEAIHFGRPRA